MADQQLFTIDTVGDEKGMFGLISIIPKVHGFIYMCINNNSSETFIKAKGFEN